MGLRQVWIVQDSILSRWCPYSHNGIATSPTRFAYYPPPALEFEHHKADSFSFCFVHTTVLSTEKPLKYIF